MKKDGMRIVTSISRKKRPVGYCIGRTDTLDKKTIELKVLFVYLEYRKNGYGTKLVQRFLTQAKKKGFSSVYLTPAPYGENDDQMDLETLERFYRKLGFRKSKNILTMMSKKI